MTPKELKSMNEEEFNSPSSKYGQQFSSTTGTTENRMLRLEDEEGKIRQREEVKGDSELR